MCKRILLRNFFSLLRQQQFGYFCGLLGEYLPLSKLNNAKNTRVFISEHNFQWMNFARQWVLRGSLFTQFLSMVISWTHISQGRVATCLRCGGIFRPNKHFTANSLLNQPAKEFWKSVKIWLSYSHEFGGLLFWNAVYSVKAQRQPNIVRSATSVQ